MEIWHPLTSSNVVFCDSLGAAHTALFCFNGTALYRLYLFLNFMEVGDHANFTHRISIPVRQCIIVLARVAPELR